MKPSPDCGPPWTDSGVAKLRITVLEDALSRLAKPRLPPNEQAELLAWLRSDLIAPFSFLACAASCGLDHEALREGLLAVLSGQDGAPEALRMAA
jgi:hypothetical protein